MNERIEFPFKYVSGGYWRSTESKKGEAADMLHGDAVVEHLMGLFEAKLAGVWAENVKLQRELTAVRNCGNCALCKARHREEAAAFEAFKASAA